METKQNEIDLIKLFRIPNFIDCSNISDVNSWRATRSILDLYLVMATSKTTLEDEVIYNICKKINYLLDEIQLNDKNYLLLYDIIDKRGFYIQEVLTENEMYEGLYNLKKYDEIEI